jgi:hypothetical protein
MKLKFYLPILQLVKNITLERPILHIVLEGGQQDPDVVRDLEQWDDNDKKCKNYMLKCLVPTLYDVYLSCPTSKDLWNVLTKKYSM